MKSSLIVDLVRISTVYTRDVSLSNHFFDTLRKDYEEFDQWYSRIAAEGRQAWIISSKNDIDALCIFKEEYEGEKINDVGDTLSGRFLKLCTLKVADTGMKYGQRLLYSAFCYCVKNSLKSVYVQVRDGKYSHLTKLLEDYGFEDRGRYKKDICYVKDMTPGAVFPSSRAPNLAFDYFRVHYPYHLDDSNIRKFIVSLTPSEHDILFPDARNQLLAIPLPNRSILGDANAIKKIIARNTYFTYIRRGDLLFFCRKPHRGKKGVTIECVGVVEMRKQYRNIGNIPKEVLDRIPVDLEVISRMIKKSGYVMIVAFRLIPTISHAFKVADEIVDSMQGDMTFLKDELYQKYLKGRLDMFGVSNEKVGSKGGGEDKSGELSLLLCRQLCSRLKNRLLKLAKSLSNEDSH